MYWGEHDVDEWLTIIDSCVDVSDIVWLINLYYFSYIAEHEQQLDHVSKMSHQQEQLADRIRHYEAQIQVLVCVMTANAGSCVCYDI